MAGSCLVLVESPGKVKTIKKYLDSISPNTYEVMASVGHICDLPKKDLGFDTNTFLANYQVYEEKQDLVRQLKAAVRRSEKVILATDDDREGEAIAAHLKRELGLKDPDRIVFTSITKDSLAAAIKSPRKIDQKKVDSQETRRLLDRMIGWLVSSVARNYVVPDSSMGRVQTAVLCLLVHLERLIRDFVPTQHYGVDAYMIGTVNGVEAPWSASWVSSTWFKGDQEYWTDRKSAEVVAQVSKLKVASVVNGTSESNPPAPFITSTLQRAAQKVLKLSPRQTMELAQKLYEAGAITYMRTDNPNLAAASFETLKKYAEDNGLPVVDSIRKFKSKGSAQEAHEAIRPTSFLLREVGQGKIQELYDLIWTRTVACQLKAAVYDTRVVELEQEVTVVIDGYQERKIAAFKARGRTLKYAGWTQLTDKDISEVEEEDRDELPNNPIPDGLSAGDVIEVSSCQLKDKKTAPPPRLTSAALIEKIEASGIGRPSTYATIVETLEARDYIKYDKNRIFVTDRGIKIIDTMEDKFKFIDVKYTAAMEETLDEIAQGKAWFPITKNFWDEINQEVEDFVKYIHTTLPQHKCEECQSLVIKRPSQHGAYWKCTQCDAKYADGANKPGVRQITKTTDFKCEECERNLVYRKGSFNGNNYEYFGCSGSSDPSALDRCYAKYEVIKASDPATPDFDLYRALGQFTCTLCSRKLLQRSTKAVEGKPSKKFWVCSGNNKIDPLCSAFYADKSNSPDYDKFAQDHKYLCVVCQGYIQRKQRKDLSGFFWMCTNVPKNRKTQCGEFYDDLEGEPNYDKYQKEHEHKCSNCESYLRDITKDDRNFWRCSSANKCGWEYEKDDNGAPKFDETVKKYSHKCKQCKFGYLSRLEGQKGPYWKCSSWDCRTFLKDVAGDPDFG